MQPSDNHSKFIALRKAFPYFVFQSYSIFRTKTSLRLVFSFDLAGKVQFYPELDIPLRSFYSVRQMPDEVLENLAFQIGMTELVSYWKAACPPVIKIRAGRLDAEQTAWWKKLYFHGLGEFFYLNGIQVQEEDFVQILSEGEPVKPVKTVLDDKKVLVPIGGGKDSIVTLELLKKGSFELFPFLLNPRAASLRTIEIAGFTPEESVIVHRKLDPALLKLNEEGFLNGHTPFSALLAFVSSLTALLSGSRYIALSNESSANQSTVPGSKINHQYSKSFEFENDFNRYLKKYIHPDLHYFSFLRPVNELQIAALFSKFPQHHMSFRSCNVGSKTDSWCGNCPKCLFTFIILSPFLPAEKLRKIFGKDMLDDRALQPLMDELNGTAAVKPFECVGTPSEVNAALGQAVDTGRIQPGKALVASSLTKNPLSAKADFPALLHAWNPDHQLPPAFLKIIQKAVDDVAV